MENTTTYEKIGGAATVGKLCDRFYELMDTVPQFQGIRAMHPADLTNSRDKLYMFLSGWMGGPDLFVEKFGHPRLRGRHMPFAIGGTERDQWLLCMRQAMTEQIDDAPLRAALDKALTELADFMRNQPG